MTQQTSSPFRGSVVEEEILLTTVELGHAIEASEQQIELWVFEGVLQPIGESRAEWRFGGEVLARMRVATHLTRDLELNAPGVALALELLDRIAALEARLHRAGMAYSERIR
ncbi:MAG: chaperone modulator CbpM [Caldimonas sp.]